MKNYISKPVCWLVFTLTFFNIVSCSKEAKKEEKESFNPDAVKPIIIEMGKRWSKACKDSSTEIIATIYDSSAHYLPDDYGTQHGVASIINYWKSSFPVIKDVVLKQETLEGTKEIVYETGTGYCLLKLDKNKASLDTGTFRYMNVWKLQSDGTYKCVIDMYNGLPKE